VTRRVVIDGTLVGTRVTGAARVLTNLIRTLPEVDPQTEYIALVTSEGASVLGGAASELVSVSFRSGLRWEIRERARAATVARAGAIFTVRELVAGGGPPVVLHLFEPPSYRLGAARVRSLGDARRVGKDRILALGLRGSVRRAAAVTAGSQTTADWLRYHYGVEADVVYPGLDRVFLEEQGPSADPPAPYLLHSASGDVRDNTDLVLAAFARLRHWDVRLSVVSTPAELRPALLARLSALGISDRVDVLGWISDEELRELYQGALLFLHVTKFEAFAGLPALEAMALGTLVVALEAPGATEALAGVARLVPREDPELLAAEIDGLLDDGALRASLAAAGRERARELTWEASAQSFARVFHRLLR
jgi:glycosyltransferase involved in cell wall biosynthesis